MDNAYYILAEKQIEIERLHICTWEFPSESSYIEFGVEFSYENFSENTLTLLLAAPFIKTNSPVTCLLKNLSDRANGRFIFNDVVCGIDNVGDDSRDGSILKFERREKLTILPCAIDVKDGIITFVVNKPNRHEGNLYFRVLIKLEDSSVAIKKSGIAQTTYIYDFKINETRNLPQEIYDLKKNHRLKICKVNNVFCLHAIPDNFAFSFVDSSKLKNIRKLETSAFQQYLPEVKGISKDCYNIMFLKDSEKESYSLFSICNEETIGSRQIALAVGVNILCSLLFAFSALRFVKDPTIEWYKQIPWEYWGAFAILIILCIYLSTPLKKKL